MSEKDSKNTLVDFMKKQASKKSSEQKSQEYSLEKTRYEKKEEEANEKKEEELKDARNESNAKMANQDKSRMIMKLIVESSAKYFLMLVILVGVAFLLVEAVPMIAKFFHGLVAKMLFSAIK